ncbi:MAG: hypothetical protein ACLFVQ_12475 [Chitinispirillaceae bacterium]
MNTMLTYIEWLFPLLIIPVGYVFYRFAPFRKMRYYIYALILVMAFFFDLLKVSFRSEVIDTVLFFSVLLIITEFIWSAVVKLKKRVLSVVVLALYLPFFLFLNSAWLRADEENENMRRNSLVDRYVCNGVEYALEKRLSRDMSDQSYIYTLNRFVPKSPLEKQVDTYTTQEGYFEAQFEYVWNCMDDGVKLDLVVGEDTLWSLGESCKKQY